MRFPCEFLWGKKSTIFRILTIISGSTALGDIILEKLGIQQSQTHWLNIFGSVYKLELPKKDITNLEEWDEHQQAAVFQSFLSFALQELKFKASELHIKLERSNDPQQDRIVEPLVFHNNPQEPEVNDEGIQTDETEGESSNLQEERETSNFTQQHNDEDPNNQSKKDPSHISMVFS